MSEFLSGEWLLTRFKYANGGGVVVARAAITAFIIFAGTLLARELLDPAAIWWSFDFQRFRALLIQKTPWFGAMFAAVYAALYARFASQWNYLASLYNRIKEVQVRKDTGTVEDNPALAAWWAGFIEDAEDLHLATKPMFAMVISCWGREPAVKAEFETYTVGGSARLNDLLARVDRSIAATQRKWHKLLRNRTPAKSPAAATTASPGGTD